MFLVFDSLHADLFMTLYFEILNVISLENFAVTSTSLLYYDGVEVSCSEFFHLGKMLQSSHLHGCRTSDSYS